MRSKDKKTPKKKYALTEAHRAELKPWAERWIKNAMSCDPMTEADRQAMREAINGLYRAAGLPEPQNIVFAPSPLAARIAAGFAAAIWWLRDQPGAEPVMTRDVFAALGSVIESRADIRMQTDTATDAAVRTDTVSKVLPATRGAVLDRATEASAQAIDSAVSEAIEMATANDVELHAVDEAVDDSVSDETHGATIGAVDTDSRTEVRFATAIDTSAAVRDAVRQDAMISLANLGLHVDDATANRVAMTRTLDQPTKVIHAATIDATQRAVYEAVVDSFHPNTPAAEELLDAVREATDPATRLHGALALDTHAATKMPDGLRLPYVEKETQAILADGVDRAVRRVMLPLVDLGEQAIEDALDQATATAVAVDRARTHTDRDTRAAVEPDAMREVTAKTNPINTSMGINQAVHEDVTVGLDQVLATNAATMDVVDGPAIGAVNDMADSVVLGFDDDNALDHAIEDAVERALDVTSPIHEAAITIAKAAYAATEMPRMINVTVAEVETRESATSESIGDVRRATDIDNPAFDIDEALHTDVLAALRDDVRAETAEITIDAVDAIEDHAVDAFLAGDLDLSLTLPIAEAVESALRTVDADIVGLGITSATREAVSFAATVEMANVMDDAFVDLDEAVNAAVENASVNLAGINDIDREVTVATERNARLEVGDVVAGLTQREIETATNEATDVAVSLVHAGDLTPTNRAVEDLVDPHTRGEVVRQTGGLDFNLVSAINEATDRATNFETIFPGGAAVIDAVTLASRSEVDGALLVSDRLEVDAAVVEALDVAVGVATTAVATDQRTADATTRETFHRAMDAISSVVLGETDATVIGKVFLPVDGADDVNHTISDAVHTDTHLATDDKAARATILRTLADTDRATAVAIKNDGTSGAVHRAVRAAGRKGTTATEHTSIDDITQAGWAVRLAQRLVAKSHVELLVSCAKAAWKMHNGGNHWSAWPAYLSFFRHIAKLDLPIYDKWQHYEAASMHGSSRYMHPKFCIVSDRPETLKVDDQNRPHCETGPSHRWRDGWELYHWHGVRVPDAWIKDKASLTAQMALTWQNIEQRRAACEIIGWDRILREANAKVINDSGDPEIGVLLEVELPDIGTERFLRVRCGTGRYFALPVPPEMRSAMQANAWTYGLDEHEFLKPEVRT